MKQLNTRHINIIEFPYTDCHLLFSLTAVGLMQKYKEQLVLCMVDYTVLQ
jgi:hypothetical protein